MTELKQFRQLFEQSVQEEVNLNVEKMIKLVSDKYQIEKQELFDLLQDFYDTEEPNQMSLENLDAINVNSLKCLGKTKFGTQCTRNRSENGSFCAGHSIKIPYGRVDEETDEDRLNRKRGRPRKD